LRAEWRNFEASRKIPTFKNKFGRAGENAWRFSEATMRTVKFLLNTFSVTSEAESGKPASAE